MAAADQAEVGGGIGEAAAEGDGSGGAAGVDHVQGIIVGIAGHRSGALADNAQLSVDADLDALGQVLGAQGGQTHAQIDDKAVLQLVGNTTGNVILHILLIHYFCTSTM